MLPLQLSSLVLAARALTNRNTSSIGAGRKKPLQIFSIRRLPGKAFTPVNPFNTMYKILSSLTQVRQKNESVDYNTVAARFIPPDGQLVGPKFPANSPKILLADLDGDSKKELIVTYRIDTSIKTIVLKNNNDQWELAGEGDAPSYGALNFRYAEDLTGDGKKQLLVGVTSDSARPVLYGYSFDNCCLSEIFKMDYQRLELLNPSTKNKRASGSSQLAIWNSKDSGAYDINVYKWNGQALEQQNDLANYYIRSILPYHVKEIRKNPYTPLNWYRLADVLSKSGLHNDALTAVETGIRLDSDSKYKERFEALRKDILE
ncbi:MAG: hypothetical protein GX660_10720 [Clostridiaceae bacterium]|nr:hypothetical protein [Clostridiaceae bacterium]